MIQLLMEQGLLHLDLSTPPEWLLEIRVNLPGHQTITHHFGELVPPPELPVRQLIPIFVDYLQVYENRVAVTLTGYRNRLGQFADWLALQPDHPPGQAETWVKYYASLKSRGLSAYTVKGHFHILNRFGAWLVKKKYLPAHPLEGVQPPDLPKNDLPRAIFKTHVKEMVTAANHSLRDVALLLFFRDTGCRAMEALSLTWGNIDLEERIAYALGKNNTRRKLFFKPLTRKALEKYKATLKHAKPSDPVWQNQQNGPLSYDGLYKAFKRLAARAGVSDDVFNPHSWRHAFGRDTSKAGIPIQVLQDLMGHSSPNVTKMYAQFNTDELKAEHDKYSPLNGDWSVAE